LQQDITLNIPYDLSEQEWAKVSAVYESMDGWLGDKNGPTWYGQEGDAR
jgi:adenylosuccinate synthase